MGFYNDKWIIANISNEEIFLLRKADNDILLDRIIKDTNITSKEYVVKNVLEEYDAGIGSKNELFIIYQNKDMDLVMTLLDGDKKEDIKLTSQAIPEVIDLNIKVKDNHIHIVYIIKIDEENKYRIYHNYYDGEDWETYIVEEIIGKKVLNPIKLIEDEDRIILSYYSNDLEIELKEFNMDSLEWSDPFKLNSSPNEKLYIDMIKEKDNIHLVYCEYQEGNLVIKYEKFNYLHRVYEKDLEITLSNRGSLSHPTILLYEEDLWVSWIEVDKVMSRVSRDGGISWSDSIYSWDYSRNIDFIRYKYLDRKEESGNSLDYSFGSIYPEIEFIGFGPVERANEIPLKKIHP